MMELKDKFERIYDYVRRAQTVAVVCHINPDGDAISSALSLAAAIEKLGKSVAVFCDDSVPNKLRILQNFERINTSNEKKFDLAIAVDSSDKGRVGVCYKYLAHAKSTVTIDHHKSQEPFSDFTLCMPEAAATAEILYGLIRYFEEKTGKRLIDDVIAATLYAGLVTDSGCFRFSSVTDNTLLVASELKKYNFDAAKLAMSLVFSKTLPIYNLTRRVLARTAFYLDNRIGVITFKKEDFAATGTSSADTEGIINDVTVIEGVDASIAITEEFSNSYKVSIRTREPYDASRIAATFGGGGHVAAAGCRINGYYEDVLEKLLKAVKDNL